MIFEGNAKLLATEDKVSAKTGQAYKVGLFQQGIGTLTSMLPQGVIPEINKEYMLKVDYNPQYKNLKIVEISPFGNK